MSVLSLKAAAPMSAVLSAFVPKALQNTIINSSIGISIPLGKLKEIFGVGASLEGEFQNNKDFFSNNGILRAVPKKKVSHQKRRSKLLGPGRKQEDYINHVNRCPSCGHYKRSHAICMNCFVEVRDLWSKFMNKAFRKDPLQNELLTKEDKELLYTNRKQMDFEKSALRRKEINEKNRKMERNVTKTLPVESKKTATKN